MAMIATHTSAHKVFSLTMLANSLSELFEIRRQRAALKGLSITRLEDLGLNGKQADTEARRPIWDVPVYWKQ
jgi:uncharacterized protein YjiS (DUF1127 family)